MSLDKYRQKRQFQQSPEPQGESVPGRGPLRFVVQKHQASRLHYDLRLEAGGTLKSWALPKGPSLDPDDKRLAILVEDHPIEYQHFEGIIPPGNYGAGTVMVWDRGVYCARQSSDRDATERHVLDGLAAGDIKVILDGQKLKGEFALVKLKSGEANTWLLVKKKDEFATTDDVTRFDRSALSQRRMEEIACADPPGEGDDLPGLDLGDAPLAPMPHAIKPMLATAIDRPFDRPGWLFEVKWDGFRAIAEIEAGSVRLYSRNQVGLEKRFPPVVRSLAELDHDAVLDGEIVVVDEAGRAHFERLQNYGRTGGQLVYYVFDLLYLDGHDLRALPLRRRKQVLRQILGTRPNARYCEHVEEQGRAFFRAARAHGLEGIVAKEAASRYVAGQRGPHWLKIKFKQQQDVVIGGFAEQRGQPRNLGSLVIGVYDGDDLVCVGQVGTGFDEAMLADLRARLDRIEQPECPFRTRPKPDAPVHWVRPELVCSVKFQNWTEDGVLRHPVFAGLREDLKPTDVRRESATAAPAPPPGTAPADEPPEPPRARGPASKRLSIGGHVVHVTNLHKLYWPDDGFTKADLIAYYRAVAPVLLPHLKDRPESLNRHPDGITGESFYQKDLSQAPDWAVKVLLHSPSGGRDINYLLCQDEATLAYLANLGCIEIHPWHSRVGSLDRPDYIIMDLDTDNAPPPQVAEVALAVRAVLDEAGAAGFCKTSGKRGMHVYVPLAAQYDYRQALQFAELIARLVHARVPDLTSLARGRSRRGDLVYLDYLQNRRGQTIAAPYSVRPLPGATVSTPLDWDEVRPELDPAEFTIRTVPARVERVGDLWAPLLGPGVDMAQCLDRLHHNHTKRRAK